MWGCLRPRPVSGQDSHPERYWHCTGLMRSADLTGLGSLDPAVRHERTWAAARQPRHRDLGYRLPGVGSKREQACPTRAQIGRSDDSRKTVLTLGVWRIVRFGSTLADSDHAHPLQAYGRALSSIHRSPRGRAPMGGLLPVASLVALLMLVCGSARPSTVGALLVRLRFWQLLPACTGQPRRGCRPPRLVPPRFGQLLNAIGNISHRDRLRDVVRPA